MHPGSRRSFVTGISLESQPYKPAQPGIFGSKQYCTHWIRKGECDFVQQGCIFKHVMPDLAGLQLLGYRCYPRWFREASQMTGENRELFGREPGPDPMPLPIPQPIPMPANQHPTPLPVPQPIPGPSRAGTQQASSPFDKLRNGHQDPMYGPGGPRSLFTTSSVGGGRNRNDGNNRFRGGPSRRGRHHQSWHNHSPSLFGAQPPPNGGRTPQRQMTSATAIPIRKGQNSAPAPKSGGIDEPSSPSVAASTPSAKEPMRMESLVERFSNRATPQQVSTPLSTSGPQPVLNQASTTPALGLMQSMHSGPALASTNGVTQSTHSPAPISQTTPSKIPKVAQSKPASERHTPAKPVALKSMRHFLPLIPTPQAPRAPGTTAPAPAASAPAAPAPVAPTTSHSQEAPPIRDLYDGIPKIPEPVIPRRFVSIEQPSTYVAPDATVKDESTEVNKKGQNEQHHSPQIVTKILQREKKPAEVSGQDENAAAAPTTPARRSTTRDVRLEDPAQLEAEFSRRGTWAANNQPSSRRTNGRAFRRVRNGSEYLLDLDAE